ncbi:hypothetical protein DUK53_08645 [Listeria sp. SHR_NRA_18]|uniref:hypothetical protein n=1 Tax=Listeria TaxID=1637 RepID=UPI00051D4926|nr:MULTISPECIES: hypothetical protein [Listeria]KGL46034.1 hypothetical protein EP56_02865 [Listeriaceae bacterium FSL A5-0209]KMT62559.1 hypothetical protein X559_1097 [Listeria newyorkensis]RQW66696.1 hypothetical protein DUK53_08645 [Listeria sp. SHR_NRA_18]
MEEVLTDQKEITFRIAGNELVSEEGYNLFYMIESLDCFQTLVEKSYLLAGRKSHMTAGDREQLKVKAFNIREGSFVVDLVICLRDVTVSITPLVTAMDPDALWELLVKSYEYLKVVLRAREKGESIHMEIVDSTNAFNIVNTQGDVIINNISADAIDLAKMTAPIYGKMANLISDDGKVDEISVMEKLSDHDVGIKINKEDKSLYKKRTFTDEDSCTFVGKITTANSYNSTGKIEVLEETEELPKGVYPYEFIDKESDGLLRESFTVKKKFVALRKITFNPATLEESVVSLRIVSVKD